MKKKLISLLLCLAMVLALMPTALAATTVDRVPASLTAPTVGKPFPQDLKTRSDSSAEMTEFHWEGALDANGNMMVNTNYTLTFTLKIKSGKKANFPQKKSTLRVVFNGNLIGTITEISNKKATGTLTFYINEQGKMKKSVEKVDYAWSLAEASQVNNYPLGDPITLVVNEETVTSYLGAEAYEKLLNYEPMAYRGGSDLINRYYQSSARRNVRLDTLDGRVVETKGLEMRQAGLISTWTPAHYRVTRVVYDFARPDDPTITEFPNCKELWLSPNCDIDGILRTIGSFKFGDIGATFITQDCTIFIPDSLYPNGPTYNHTPPTCKVMLYSGSDVYAAARLGREHAREWCTNHSYTYAYIGEDRLYDRGSCSSDTRFYYSCSKCGKIEGNPKHTFYPTTGSWDNMEDNGLHTECDRTQRIVTDEHFLGINKDGDRVYLYVCEHCGKDYRQKELTRTYEEDQALHGSRMTREEYKQILERNKSWWAPGGVYYERYMEKTLVGDDYNDAYAIPKDAFITAKMDSWASGEVQMASEKGLVDQALMGDDYTKPITRLQFCSVAVKLAEKMAGKTIAPAPSGTFSDTDSEYARKAYAAGITTGVGGSAFDPQGTLSRQQMATFIYRALQWVKNNSDVEYTVWDSKLGSYADGGQVAGWASDAMGFMNALGLINGTTDTTLAPNAACTIEQALMVACRSLNAGQIGWYQFTEKGSDWLHYGDRRWVYFVNEESAAKPVYKDPYGNELGITFVRVDDTTPWRPIKDR